MTNRLTAEISILVEINDIGALVAAARERCLAFCSAEFSAEETIPDGDVRAALHILFDPSIAPNGCTIINSACELSHNP